ncbi:unnamed protein product [Gongylonema pulchrum]|uniref:Hexosyltransferase n=1 Tax=Gongylonema pulchrum TaxID=637853 RepID=A0A3P7M7I9_9BILA|nr:unnamed protein product [Gongylonema pulchrum]
MQVVRARFLATELGIRDKLAVILLGQSSLTVALNASIGRHLPHLQLFVEISRIDGDIAALPNLAAYRPTGQQHPLISILGLIFNMTMHEKYDWYYIMPDTTYVNPFELMRFVNHVNWNRPVAIGYKDDEDTTRCSLQAGILLSNPAMQLLMQHRHLCNSISSSSDHAALETCIHYATNLSCTNFYQVYFFFIAKQHTSLAIVFNVFEIHRSLSVSPLLSDADAHALHQHFLHVELDRISSEIDVLSAEIASLSDDIADGPSHPAGLPPFSKPPNRHQHFLHVELDRISSEIDVLSVEIASLSDDIADGPSHPAGLPAFSKPPNRHQVPKWQFFTTTEIFKNEPNQNVYALSGDDKLDVEEIVAAARKYVEKSGHEREDSEEFVQLRNGYRLFDPMRGMDYIVDLLYRGNNGVRVHRIHLTRGIASTQLLNQVPYVKEDTDLTIVVPLGTTEEVGAVRRLLAHHVHLCESSSGDNRQTRIVVAVRGVDPSAIRLINNDVIELRIRYGLFLVFIDRFLA